METDTLYTSDTLAPLGDYICTECGETVTISSAEQMLQPCEVCGTDIWVKI